MPLTACTSTAARRSLCLCSVRSFEKILLRVSMANTTVRLVPLCAQHTRTRSFQLFLYLTSPLNASCFQLYRTLPASQPCPLTSLPSHITSMTSSLHRSLASLPCLQDPTAESPCGGSSCDRGTVLAAHGSAAAVESSRRDNCRATHSYFKRPNGVRLWIVATH